MTHPAIESSRRVAFSGGGPEKASIVPSIRAGDSQMPGPECDRWASSSGSSTARLLAKERSCSPAD